MKRSTLVTLADMVRSLESSSNELHNRIDTLNLTYEESEKVKEALMLILIKLDWIKQSNINELDRHVDIEYIEHMYKY